MSEYNTSNRHLVRPSPHVPWDVTVTGRVPECIASSGAILAYASHGAARAVFSGGKIVVWLHDKEYAFYHPLLKRADRNMLLLSVSSSSDASNYYVFGLNTATGFLALWCFDPKEKASLLPKTPNAKVKLDPTLKANVSTMMAVENFLYLGSAHDGSVWKCTVTTRPMSLTAVRLPRAATSLWNRLLFGATSSDADAAVHQIVGTKECVYSVTKAGRVEKWAGTTTPICDLQSLLQEELEDKEVQVLQLSCHNGTTLDFIVKALRPRRSRVYWIRLDVASSSSVTVENCEWINRFHDTVSCTGLVTADNGMAYGTFEYPESTTPVTVLAMGSRSATHEVDLPTREAPALVGVGLDPETHGASLVTTAGLILRTRWMQLQATARGDEDSHVVARHLMSTFWTYYQTHQVPVPLPPSLQQSSSNEAAIVLMAQQLQQQGDSASNNNPLEWHLALLPLLKATGLYKNVSSAGRWTLLGIGQELSIHAILLKSSLFSRELPPHGLANKVQQVQRHVLDHAPSAEWTVVLAQILERAEGYRDQHAVNTYDVLTDPSNLWTHQLTDVLLIQLQHSAPTDKGLETICKAALQVHRELGTREYALVKSLAIDLIRRNDKDDLAHELCLQHAHYEGLCQLALQQNDKFELDKDIFAKWDDFGPFCLHWFAQHDRFDKVLSYGKLLPQAFGALVQDTPYAWVNALREGHYETASDLLYQNANGHDVKTTEWHLSMAKLAAKVAAINDEDNIRRPRIDAKLDLVKAQRVLMDDDAVPLQSADYLLKLSLDKMEKATVESRIMYAMMALAIAQSDRRAVATVWTKIIQVDDFFAQTMSRDALIANTLFGQVWSLVQEQQPVEIHGDLQYDEDIADICLAHVSSFSKRRELKRLLNVVTTITLSVMDDTQQQEDVVDMEQ